MTYNTFPTTVIGPSYPVDTTYQPKILTVNFGNGYTQQAPDGINYNMRKFSLTWEVLTSSELTTINNFLLGQGGYLSFNWVTPNGDTALVKCNQWDSSATNPGTWALKAVFMETTF